jgi:AcrR family transcriptional regulator
MGGRDVAEDQDRREAILRAAVTVFQREGYQGASVRAITEAAGCATGTFYLYFPSKDDCFLALIERLYRLVLDAVVERRAGVERVTDKLWVSIGAVTDVFSRERELAAVVLLQGPGISAGFREHLQRVRIALADLIVEDLREAGMEAWPAACAARALTGALGEVLVWQVADNTTRETFVAAGEEVRRLFWRGFGFPWPATSARLAGTMRMHASLERGGDEPMVDVVKVTQRGDAWEVDLKIREGVYRLDQYPVRVENVPLPPTDLAPAEQERRMAAFVVQQVTQHMRRGSLPPRGTRLDGSTVWERASQA